jgi:hypothetical protein
MGNPETISLSRTPTGWGTGSRPIWVYSLLTLHTQLPRGRCHNVSYPLSTPLPALASQHTICLMYLNVSLQIANKLGTPPPPKKTSKHKFTGYHVTVNSWLMDRFIAQRASQHVIPCRFFVIVHFLWEWLGFGPSPLPSIIKIIGNWNPVSETLRFIVFRIPNGGFFVLENREYGDGDPLRWPRNILYPQELALT